MNSTPQLIVPAEESAHDLTFMQWPVSRQVHPDHVFLRQLQDTIARIANTISQFEPVVMLGADKHHRTLRKRLSGNVELWNIPTDDLWCRDSGPLFALNEKVERVISHLKFNGWGGKQIHENDGAVVTAVADALQLPIIDSGLWSNLPNDPDRQDSFHKAAMETHDKLLAASMDVEVIPEPNKRRVKGMDFVASYANYYAFNGAIVAAEYGDSETDAIAYEALEQHYPGREVETLNVDALGEVGGGIHCATQQMPVAG